jgi:hypothetical protein
VPKSKGRRRSPIPTKQTLLPPLPTAGAMQVSLGYDPNGAMEQRDVVASRDGWSEYELDDGTIIRSKAAIIDIKKAVGQYNTNGEPVYVLQLTVVHNVKVPDRLKKQK